MKCSLLKGSLLLCLYPNLLFVECRLCLFSLELTVSQHSSFKSLFLKVLLSVCFYKWSWRNFFQLEKPEFSESTTSINSFTPAWQTIGCVKVFFQYCVIADPGVEHFMKHLLRAVFVHWPIADESSVAIKIFIRFAERNAHACLRGMLTIRYQKHNLLDMCPYRRETLTKKRPCTWDAMRPVGFAPRKKQCELLFLWEQTIINTIVPFSSREPFSLLVNERGTFVLLTGVSPSQARVHIASMI